MILYLIRRIIYMAVMLVLLSVVTFIIIQLPPGDYLTMYVQQLTLQGQSVAEAEIASLKRQYGLDLPVYLQYFKWIWRALHGDFGRSFQRMELVSDLIRERLMYTILLNIFVISFTYLASILIGIYSAVNKYTFGDYFFTVVGFAGLAIPNFLLALAVMVTFHSVFGLSVTGLFSPEYNSAPWSWAKFFNLLKHLPVPVIVIGLANTAGLIRVTRGCLLDELRKQYVVTARAKGLSEKNLLFRYPVRVALNPVVSTIGWVLPSIISGGTIAAIVLNLPTIGPLLYRALLVQDMYLAGTIVLFLGLLTIVGTFVSDMLLVGIDPRITYRQRNQ